MACAADLLLRTSVAGSSGPLGQVEAIHAEVAGIFRSLKGDLEDKINEENGIQDNIVPRMVRHAAWCRTRFSTGHDGLSPYERLKGVPYRGQTLNIGEQVLVKHKVESGRAFKGSWTRAVWLGKAELNDARLVATGIASRGCAHCTDFRRASGSMQG